MVYRATPLHPVILDYAGAITPGGMPVDDRTVYQGLCQAVTGGT